MALHFDDYEEASKLNEEVASVKLEFSDAANTIYFRTCVCHLCIDGVNAANAVTRYNKEAQAFVDSKEVRIVRELYIVMEDWDLERYHSTVKKNKLGLSCSNLSTA